MYNDDEKQENVRSLKLVIDKLWRTGELYRQKPDVLSELKNVLYYLVNVFLFVCYLPIMILLWFFDSFLGVNLYGLETSVVKKIDIVDEIIFPYTEFHINKWPKSVREHCFLCTKLKTSAVKKTAADVNKVFTEKIPQNFKDAGKFFTIGNKQFAEIFNMPVKTLDSCE